MSWRPWRNGLCPLSGAADVWSIDTRPDTPVAVHVAFDPAPSCSCPCPRSCLCLVDWLVLLAPPSQQPLSTSLSRFNSHSPPVRTPHLYCQPPAASRATAITSGNKLIICLVDHLRPCPHPDEPLSSLTLALGLARWALRSCAVLSLSVWCLPVDLSAATDILATP